MAYVLKIYLYSSARRKYEIRRIGTPIYTYRELHQMICALFPSLNGKTFEISWKDDEGDDILLSSTPELDQAIESFGNMLHRLYVHVADENVETSDVPCGKQEIHPNIVCNACNGKVQGYRYVCLQCDDYNLCNSCHTQGKHLDHDMMKLVSPSNVAHSWNFPLWPRLSQNMFEQFPITPENFADGHIRCSSNMQGSCHKDKGSPNFSSKCPWNHRVEYAKNISQTVKNLLNSLVFDVTVDVVQSDHGQESSFSKVATHQEFDVEKNMQTVPEGQKAMGNRAAENSSNSSESSSVVENNVSSSATIRRVEADTTTPLLGVTPKIECLSPDESGPSEEATPEKPADLFAAVEEAVKTRADDDWTMINSVIADSVKNNEIYNKAAVSESFISPDVKNDDESAPSADEKEDVPLHHDPKIVAALQKMLDFGFTNEGGWLLRLLETKNGNIREALDTMYCR